MWYGVIRFHKEKIMEKPTPLQASVITVALFVLIGALLPAQNKTDTKMQCAQLQKEEMEALRVASQEGPIQDKTRYYAESAAYGVAFQNCVAQNK